MGRTKQVTILILVETLLQYDENDPLGDGGVVTILILVETLLQSNKIKRGNYYEVCHNPYFSGNSFAMVGMEMQRISVKVSQSLF